MPSVQHTARPLLPMETQSRAIIDLQLMAAQVPRADYWDVCAQLDSAKNDSETANAELGRVKATLAQMCAVLWMGVCEPE